MKRIETVRSPNLQGEPTRLFDQRTAEGFWDKFIRPGVVVDIGYKGAVVDNAPIFKDAIGLDLDTPGYNGRDLPFPENSIGTIHTSHLLEHVSDYGYFLRECFRVLSLPGTLILIVPLMNTYERKPTPPSLYNADHKRFYTAARLLYEIETSVPRQLYRVIHLREHFLLSDLDLPYEKHAVGPYEIECVIEKIG